MKYQSHRDYVAANFASRTMRWTGRDRRPLRDLPPADLTWGTANPHFVRGDVYDNVIDSFKRVPVAIIYIVANLALAIHLFHGAWSMFQSLGLEQPAVQHLAPLLRGRASPSSSAIGNVSMPLLVVTGVVTE